MNLTVKNFAKINIIWGAIQEFIKKTFRIEKLDIN